MQMYLVFFCTIVGALASNNTDINRIVGGQVASPGQFPHQVSLQNFRHSHFCGGSIINANTILTAAHCVYGRTTPSSILVVTGTNSLRGGGATYQVSRFYYHEQYNPGSTTNDVAILKIAGRIQFNSFTKPIDLASSATNHGETLTLSGWGLTSYPGSLPSELQYINLICLELQTCSRKLQGANPVTNGHVCTTSPPGNGACQGDSGGPLINSKGQQVGIVSWGIPCAKGYPDVFTSVPFYKSWIESSM